MCKNPSARKGFKCVYVRLILTLRFWYWYFLMTLLTVSRSSLMALAMSLWKETRTGEEIFGQVEPCNFGFISPVNRADWNFAWNHCANSSTLASGIKKFKKKNIWIWSKNRRLFIIFRIRFYGWPNMENKPTVLVRGVFQLISHSPFSVQAGGPYLIHNKYSVSVRYSV